MFTFRNTQRRRSSTLLPFLITVAMTLSLSPGIASATPAMDHFHPAAQRPVVTSTSAVASNLGGTVATIHGQHLSTASGALFGSVPGTDFHALSDSTAQVTAPAHTVGTLDVRVESSAGMSPPTAHDHVSYLAGSPMPAFAAATTTLDVEHDANLKISCFDESFCVGLERMHYVVRTNGVWSKPTATRASYQLAIDCPARGVCYAIGVSSGETYLETFRNGVWTSVVVSANTAIPADSWSLSCGGPQDCVGLSVNYDEVRLRGRVWKWIGTVSNPFTGPTGPITCPTASYCRAFGVDSTWILNDGTWQREAADVSPGPSRSGSCAAVDFCVTLGRNGVTMWDGATWTVARSVTLPTGPFRERIGCSSVADCWLVISVRAPVQTVRAWHWNGSDWAETAGPHIADPTYFDCASNGPCIVSGNGELVESQNGGWSSPTRVDRTTGNLNGFSCSSRTFCATTDTVGNVSVLHGGAWSSLEPPLATSPVYATPISCPVNGVCVTPQARYGNGVWSADTSAPSTQQDEPYVAITCVGSSWCIAATKSSRYTVFDGENWSALRSTDVVLRGGPLVCASPGACIALSAHDSLARFVSGVWHESDPIPLNAVEEPRNLSCVGTTFCVVGSDYRTFMLFDGSWSTYPVDGALGISCRATNDCVAAGTTPTHWDGASWRPLPNDRNLFGIVAGSFGYAARVGGNSIVMSA